MKPPAAAFTGIDIVSKAPLTHQCPTNRINQPRVYTSVKSSVVYRVLYDQTVTNERTNEWTTSIVYRVLYASRVVRRMKAK